MTKELKKILNLVQDTIELNQNMKPWEYNKLSTIELQLIEMIKGGK